MPQTILCIEDDPILREQRIACLSQEGYVVLEAANGETGIAAAMREHPDVVLVGLKASGMSGLDVAKELLRNNETRNISVVLFTDKADEVDRIVALELGCEDYLSQSISLRELMLRLRIILRRRVQEPSPKQPRLTSSGIRIDAIAHRVLCNDREVLLTITEYRLLEDMLRNRGSVRTREQLLESVWGNEPEGNIRTVDTHVRRLRVKLGDWAPCVETVRGVGYRFSEQVPANS